MRKYGQYVLVLLLIALVFAGISLFGRPRFVDTLPLRDDLPGNIDHAKGMLVWFCQNEACANSITEMEAAVTNCPSCGGIVGDISPWEKRVLPPDTRIRRKFYQDELGAGFLVTIVTTGRSRTGIHRPELCLEAQGYRIVGQQVVEVPLLGRAPLRLALFDCQRNVSRPTDKPRPGSHWYYAYWFVGRDLETPSHYQRMARSAWDNIVNGTSYRWAYVSIMIQRHDSSPVEGIDRLKTIVTGLYPLLLKDESR
jgi:hypothetical protein